MFIRVLQNLLDIAFPRSKFKRTIDSIGFDDFVERSSPLRVREHEGVTYFFDYKNDFVRDSIHELKYRGNKKIALWYARIIFEHLLEYGQERERDATVIVMPAPLSKKKYRARGWNQCEYITKAIEKRDTEKYFEYDYRSLKKVLHTESQTRMKNRKERMKNPEGVFGVARPDLVYKNHIVVIDDVVTTGSTMREISKVLKKAGAIRVTLIAVAH